MPPSSFESANDSGRIPDGDDTGRGVTLTHELTVIVSRDNLITRPLPAEPGVRHIRVAYPTGPMTTAAETVLNTLRSVGEQHQTQWPHRQQPCACDTNIHEQQISEPSTGDVTIYEQLTFSIRTRSERGLGEKEPGRSSAQ